MTSPINAFVALSVDYGSSMSGTLNTGAGSNIEGLVFVMGDPTGTTVTIGGVSATAGGNISGFSNGVTVYRRPGLPANSALPVVVNFSGSGTESAGFAVAVNDVDPTGQIANTGGLAIQYATPTAGISFTNSVNGIVLSFISTRTAITELFSEDTAHSATLVGTKNNGTTGSGAAYCGLQWYPAGTTSAGWNWTATGGAKVVTHMAVVLTPAAAATGTTVNLVGANSAQGSASSTGAATVTPAGSSPTSTVVSAVFEGYGGLPLTGLTIPNVMLIKLDRSVTLSLANQTTDATTARMTIPNVPVSVGTDLMLATFNADGTTRGFEKVTTQ